MSIDEIIKELEATLSTPMEIELAAALKVKCYAIGDALAALSRFDLTGDPYDNLAAVEDAEAILEAALK